VAARPAPAGIYRRGLLPDRTPPGAAPDRERHRRRGRHVPPCRRSGAAPSRAGPDGPCGEASRGRRTRRPGGGTPRLRGHGTRSLAGTILSPATAPVIPGKPTAHALAWLFAPMAEPTLRAAR